jgi:hypothetical protein
MHWLIIRTEFRREQAVSIQIAKKGFPVWVPVQKIRQRPTAARTHMDRSNTFQIKDRAVCPSLFFAAVPVEQIDRILGLRGMDRVEQTSEGTWALVPDEQVRAFREAIDRENAAALALAQSASRGKQKAVWRSLKDGLMDAMERAKQVMEQVA